MIETAFVYWAEFGKSASFPAARRSGLPHHILHSVGQSIRPNENGRPEAAYLGDGLGGTTGNQQSVSTPAAALQRARNGHPALWLRICLS